MNYLDEVVKELRQQLQELELGREPDEFLWNVRQKLLESYKNGVQAVRRGRPNQYKKSKTPQ